MSASRTSSASRADGAGGYPPPPWRLGGQLHTHLFLVRRDRLPATPPGFRPLLLAGRGIVVAGWVDYQRGALSYGELFAAVAGFARRRLTATVTHMWVDSAASRDGGRELWGYPKELAEFDIRIRPAGTAAARRDGRELAHGDFRAWVTAPARLRLRSGTVQWCDGALKPVRIVVTGAPSLGRGGLSIPPGSPLAFLRGARRLASTGLRDFDATFG